MDLKKNDNQIDAFKLNNICAKFNRVFWGDYVETNNLIYDWNEIDYDISRNPANHPHGVWFDDETTLQTVFKAQVPVIQQLNKKRNYYLTWKN